MLRLKDLNLVVDRKALASISNGKILINTVNAHSFNTAQKDDLFADALRNGDYLIPDGVSIVKACKWLKQNHNRKKGLPDGICSCLKWTS